MAATGKASDHIIKIWRYWDWGWQSVTVNVHLMDENGNELLPESEHLSQFDVSTDGTITISEQAPYVRNYTYQYAVVASDFADAHNETSQVRRLRVNNDAVQYSSSASGNNDWHNLREGNEVYLIYSKDTAGSTGGGGGDVDVDLPTPQISKKAVSNGDGIYDLSLSVTGSVGSQSSTVNVDVLMIVDESNSMTGNRIANTKEAMKTLIDSLEFQERVNARYSIYTFGHDARDEMNGWQTMPDNYQPGVSTERDFGNTTVGRAVNGISNSGEGTNYEAALQAAAVQLASAREDAITVVVFLSDGSPSQSLNWGNGTSVMENNSFWAWRETLETADDIYCDQFYSVGISADQEQFMGDSTDGYGGLINAVNATTKVYRDTDDDGGGLSDIFSDIAGSVTNLFIENVTITDIINTQNVERVVNADGMASDLKISISDGDPQTDDAELTKTEVAVGSIVASYENGILT